MWLFDLASGAPRRFTRDPTAVTYATWSPNSQRVVFASRRQGRMDLFESARDADAGSERLLYADGLDKFPTSWSPDGQTLLFQAVSPQTGADIWTLPMTGAGERQARPFLHTPASERSARFSPDGKWIAYSSEESGRLEIRVVSFPEAKQVITISESGGEAPRWRSDGKELFYIAPDRMLHATAIVKTEGSIRALSDTALFIVPSRDAIAATFDVSADGQRFIVPVSGAPTEPSLSVLVNWPFAPIEQH
jgi:Tol biopolymer transport system component